MKDLAQIERLSAGLTLDQGKRLDQIKSHVKVALARKYGNDLNEMMVDALINEAICHPIVLMGVEGLPNAVPEDRNGWDALAADIVAENELAQRCIAFSREARVNELRQVELEKLPPQQRISLARSGKLDAYIAARVRNQVEGVR